MTTITTSVDINIYENDNNYYYSNMDGSGETGINDFPITINNQNNDGTIITVNFTTSLNIYNSDFYFVCITSNITFDGYSNTITLHGIENYLGLIQNGTTDNDGKNYITVKNIGCLVPFPKHNLSICFDANKRHILSIIQTCLVIG